MTKENKKITAIIILLSVSLYTSCTHSKQSDSSTLIRSEYCLKEESIQAHLPNEENRRDSIHIEHNNGDEAEDYCFIGSIHNGCDSLQFVIHNYYFNIATSQRCNNKLLVFMNKEYCGYYYIGDSGIRFYVKDNNLWCAVNNTATCLKTVYENKFKLTDWFIYYKRGDSPIGDSVYFTKYNSDSLKDSMQTVYMF